MKSAPFTAFVTVLLLVACSKAPTPDPAVTAAETGAGQVSAPATVGAESAVPAKTGSASGTVESVDAAAGKITIAHGAVQALDWPAMTMAFAATPEQIGSIKAGDKVRFEFESQGMQATIIRIEPAN